ncbi:MAG: DUF2400 domain-containing protein [Bacteroidales bacterium]
MKDTLIRLAEKYNNPIYFQTDPIIFPKHFFELYKNGKSNIQDVEISGIIAAHLAWGRREMIVRDCKIALDEMNWKPYEYIKKGNFKCENCSLHRTVKWSEFAIICNNLRSFYDSHESIEDLDPDSIRTKIFNQNSDKKAANKKIHMLRRWMVRNDGIVDLGIWNKTSPVDLIIPLDVHVHRVAMEMKITSRKSADLSTALEITQYLKEVFPEDPCKGDFALFGYGIDNKKKYFEEDTVDKLQ